MSPARKLLVFAPQMIGAAMSTASSSVATLLVNHLALFVPAVVFAIATGLVAVISTVAKAINIDSEDDWERLAAPCWKCVVMKRDLDETRRALVELRP